MYPRVNQLSHSAIYQKAVFSFKYQLQWLYSAYIAFFLEKNERTPRKLKKTPEV